MEIKNSHTVIEMAPSVEVTHYGYTIETDTGFTTAEMFWSREERARFEAFIGRRIGNALLGRRLGAPAAVIAFGTDEFGAERVRRELQKEIAKRPPGLNVGDLTVESLVQTCRNWHELESQETLAAG